MNWNQNIKVSPIWHELTTNLRSDTTQNLRLAPLTIIRGGSRSGKSRIVDSVRLLLSGKLPGLSNGKSVADFTSGAVALSARLQNETNPGLTASVDMKVGAALPSVSCGADLLSRLPDEDALPHSAFSDILSFGPEKFRRAINSRFGVVSDSSWTPSHLSDDQSRLWAEVVATIDADADLSFLDAVAKALDSISRQSARAISLFDQQIERTLAEVAAVAGDHEPLHVLEKQRTLAREADLHKQRLQAFNDYDLDAIMAMKQEELISTQLRRDNLQQTRDRFVTEAADLTARKNDLTSKLRALAKEAQEHEQSQKEQKVRVAAVADLLQRMLDRGTTQCPLCESAVTTEHISERHSEVQMLLNKLNALLPEETSTTKEFLEEYQRIDHRLKDVSAQLSAAQTTLREVEGAIEAREQEMVNLKARHATILQKIDSTADEVANYSGPSAAEIEQAISARMKADAVENQLGAVYAQRERELQRVADAKTLKQIAQEQSAKTAGSATERASAAVNRHLPDFFRVEVDSNKSSFRFRVRFRGEKRARSIQTLCGTEFAMLRTAVALAWAIGPDDSESHVADKIIPLVLDDAELAMMDGVYGEWMVNHLVDLLDAGVIDQAFIAWPASWAIKPPHGNGIITHDLG